MYAHRVFTPSRAPLVRTLHFRNAFFTISHFITIHNTVLFIIFYKKTDLSTVFIYPEGGVVGVHFGLALCL